MPCQENYLWWTLWSCCRSSWMQWSSSSTPVNPKKQLYHLFFYFCAGLQMFCNRFCLWIHGFFYFVVFAFIWLQMVPPVDCLLKAVNCEWLNKSDVDILRLQMETMRRRNDDEEDNNTERLALNGMVFSSVWFSRIPRSFSTFFSTMNAWITLQFWQFFLLTRHNYPIIIPTN